MKYVSLDGLSYFYKKLKVLYDGLLKNSHTHSNKATLDKVVPFTFSKYNQNSDEIEKANILPRLTNLEVSTGLTVKNLLKNTEGTVTQNGITFTHNADGSVTCNGTATADTNYRYIITLPENTSFILSGCPTGGSMSTYNMFAMDADSWSKIYRDTGSGVKFNTGSCSTWHFIIRIANGQAVSDLTFYPMLRNADTFEENAPYTPYVGDLQSQISESIETAARKANDTGVGRFWKDSEGVIHGEIFGSYENNVASGDSSHAQGYQTTASGISAHSQGSYTKAAGRNSFAGGEHTIAQSECQSAIGRCNVEDIDGKFIFIIGNGVINKRSNALTVDWNGNLRVAGDIITDNSSLDMVNEALGMSRKNLLKNTTGTATQNGMTFTHNSDGSVTCNGTATADTNYTYVITLPQNTSFILSGCPAGGSASTYNLHIIDTVAWNKIYRDTGNAVTFNTGTITSWECRIQVKKDTALSNRTFYPMLRNAAIENSAYAPYADDLQTQINELKAQFAAHIVAASS